MTESAANYDYDAYHQAFASEFLRALGQFLPAVQGQEVALISAGDALLDTQTHLIVDEASRANLRLGTLVLVTYRAQQGTVPQETLLGALQQAFCTPFRQDALAGTRAMLDHAPDPLAALAQVSREREEHFFGPAFTFQRLQDDQFAYLVNVNRCLWHTFFVRQGAPELTPVFCAFDLNWMDAVNPAQHGLRVERPTTLGWGHDQCRFWHIRTQTEKK